MEYGTNPYLMMSNEIPPGNYELQAGSRSTESDAFSIVLIICKNGYYFEPDDFMFGRFALDFSALQDGVYKLRIPSERCAVRYEVFSDDFSGVVWSSRQCVYNTVAIIKYEGLVTILGDVNFDGYVNVYDVSLVYKCILGGEYDVACDITGNGFINVEDVSYLYRIILGQ